LALLDDGPKYGLQLRQEFEARTGEVWPLNVGQVYTTLQRLERDGMVAALSDGDDGPQKGYEITDGGHQELLDWLQTPPEVGQPPRDELLIKVLVAVGVRGVDVHEVVQVHRRHLVQLMQRYTAVKADAGADDVALALIVDAELFRLEAAVRWLDSAEVRLRHGVPAVVPDRRPTNTLLEAARRSSAAATTATTTTATATTKAGSSS
jgi:DNA-binding PadR family transcriptional regulator